MNQYCKHCSFLQSNSCPVSCVDQRSVEYFGSRHFLHVSCPEQSFCKDRRKPGWSERDRTAWHLVLKCQIGQELFLTTLFAFSTFVSER